jgi:uncharacterized damage-inducible protein DinB
MKIIPMLLKEMDEEAQTTRKMLSAIPDGKYDWQPHEKSMTIRRLANHLGEIPIWVTMALMTDELDFANSPYEAENNDNTADVLAYFDRSFTDGKAHLGETNEDVLQENWTLRNGGHVISVRTKAEVVRMAFSQMVHHRAQLGVFLRLLNVPIPGSYGPSADEMSFK